MGTRQLVRACICEHHPLTGQRFGAIVDQSFSDLRSSETGIEGTRHARVASVRSHCRAPARSSPATSPSRLTRPTGPLHLAVLQHRRGTAGPNVPDHGWHPRRRVHRRRGRDPPRTPAGPGRAQRHRRHHPAAQSARLLRALDLRQPRRQRQHEPGLPGSPDAPGANGSPITS